MTLILAAAPLAAACATLLAWAALAALADVRRVGYGARVGGTPTTVSQIVAGIGRHPERWDGRVVRLDAYVAAQVAIYYTVAAPLSAFQLVDRRDANPSAAPTLEVMVAEPAAGWQARLHALPLIGSLVPSPNPAAHWWEATGAHGLYLVLLHTAAGMSCTLSVRCVGADLLGIAPAS